MKRTAKWFLVALLALLVIAGVAMADPKPPGGGPTSVETP